MSNFFKHRSKTPFTPEVCQSMIADGLSPVPPGTSIATTTGAWAAPNGNQGTWSISGPETLPPGPVDWALPYNGPDGLGSLHMTWSPTTGIFTAQLTITSQQGDTIQTHVTSALGFPNRPFDTGDLPLQVMLPNTGSGTVRASIQ